MRFKWTLLLPAFLLLTLGMAVGVEIDSFLSGRFMDQRDKLEQAFRIITRQYVDEVDTNALVEDAIAGMLQELDPHSTYISASEIEEVQEEYQGSFGGIGIWFEILKDTARVVSTISDGPSEKVGLMAGDRIIAVNDSSAIGFKNNDVQKHLKGPIGTSVRLTVKRPGVRNPLRFTITRSRIPLYTVDSAYMIDNQTGYLHVNRFAMTTYEEFLSKLQELKGKGMQRLVLDLRDNPGGVMDAAINMADEFLKGGQTIVYTKSRHRELEAIHKSTGGGSFETEPLIVLVSPYSASASEIVAGALQDQDRALIVGQRTFGKGLVQQQFRLDDGSVLQMTVSRYYTPVGRLIQTPYKNGNQESYYASKLDEIEKSIYHPADYANSVPDSLRFKTGHGRVVFGGGGIMPDYVVAPDTTSILWEVAVRGMDDLFMRDLFTRNEQRFRNQWGKQKETFFSNYKIDDRTWEAFVDTLSARGIRLDEKTAPANAKGTVHSKAELNAARPLLETRLKAYLARQLFGAESALPLLNSVDPVLTEAVKYWNRAEDLAKYHRSGR